MSLGLRSLFSGGPRGYSHLMKKTGRGALGAGLLLGLSVAAAAQTAASRPVPAAPAQLVTVMAGTKEGEARRKALLGAISDWKTLLPEQTADSRTAKLLSSLHGIKEEAAGLKAGEQVEPVEKKFEDWKQAVLSELYAGNKERFFNDPARFQEHMQKRLDALTAIRDQKARVPSQSKKLEALKAKINAVPDAATLNSIYDKLNAGRKAKTEAPVRTVSFSGVKSQALDTVFTAKAVFPTPERIAPPPAPVPQPSGSVGGAVVPAKAELASFKTEPATTSSLSRLISTVSATARRYADKVADSIVAFSRKLGLDERLEAAFVWAESAFNPHAKSYAGAEGLGQLMPGTAKGLGVHDSFNIDENLRGSTTFVKGLMNRFSSDDEMRYTQGLYAWGKNQVQAGRPVKEVWGECFEKTPMGVKNAIAAYNAGAGAISVYGHGRYDRLPVSHTAYAESHNVGYWQTIHYVPSVLRHYFDVILATPTTAAPAPLVAQA